MALLAWLGLTGYCALYTGGFAMVVALAWKALGVERVWRTIVLVFVIPAAWVGFEFLRSNLLTGFAWNALGVSQFRQVPIIQLAEFGGVYTVSAFLVLVNTALMLTGLRLVAMLRRQKVRRLNVELMIAMSVWGFGIWTYFDAVKAAARLSSEGTSIRITSVQPNIPQYKKWPEEFEKEIYAEVKEQTEYAMRTKPDLIVWPETVVPGPVRRDPMCAAFVADLASRSCPILVGSLDYLTAGDTDIIYNSSVLVDANGRVVEQYNKRHLVPFGEYLPFESSVPLIQKMDPLGFCCTPGTTSTVFRLIKPAIPFSVLICFEDTVAGLAIESVKNGARLLINQTNDAWFDGSCAAVQHMAHCVFRCVENRVPAVRSANTGVTCYIDTVGRIDALENAGRLTEFAGFAPFNVAVPPADMATTFYTRHGDVPFALPCGLAAALALALAVYTIRRESRLKTFSGRE